MNVVSHGLLTLVVQLMDRRDRQGSSHDGSADG